MKTIIRSVCLILTMGVFSCVTINIYFPAEEIRGAADKIVNEVWGDKAQEEKENGVSSPAERSPNSGLYHIRFTNRAYAAQDINVSTPAIRTIKESIKSRANELIPLLRSGNVGLGHDGLLKIRQTEGLSLQQKGKLNQLVTAENQDRLRLYLEIAKANNFPDRSGEVQSIFANSWREQAEKGWLLENANGNWSQK